MGPDPYDDLEIAIRAYAVRGDVDDDVEDAGGGPRRGRARRRQPQRTLVVDCETTVDAAQGLLFGAYATYEDRWGLPPCGFCTGQGFFHDDDLAHRDPDGTACLKAFVQTHRAHTFPGRGRKLALLTRSQFVEDVLWPFAYRRGATVVAFNAPFDLTRIAIAATTGKGRFYRWNSLRLYERETYRPRIAYKTVDSKRALIAFTAAWEGR